MGSLWNRSGTIERYADDIRAAGAKVYFFNGGTTTPMSVFRDAGEGSAHPNPVVADAHGRWPDIFIPFVTSYDVRVTTADNVQLTYTLQVPNPNPVDVSTIVDPANTVQTGMIHAEFVNTIKPGYVRLNGLTIGNASSHATERANDADTFPLFSYLWRNLPESIAPVSPGGRGISPEADFSPGNKNIVLPDMRGAVLVGLDDMGNIAAGAFAGLSFNTGNATTAGSSIGVNSFNMSTAQLPSHTHAASISIADGAHTHTTGIQSANHTHSGTTNLGDGSHTHTSTSSDGAHSHSLANVGGPGNAGSAPIGLINVTAGFGNVTAASPTLSWLGAAITINGVLDHSHSVLSGGSTHTHGFTSGNQSADHTHNILSSGEHTHTITVSSVGSGTLINNLGLSRLVTWFIKL